jgi:HTH-type transcriptional regulator / antitoxin HigA
MANINELIPAPEPDYAVPPGETLRERLDDLGMSQADLARRTGLTAKHVNQVMQGVVPLSADVAQRLEYAIGIPARWWLRLEADYQAANTRISQRQALSSETPWVKTMPVASLVKIGALPVSPSDEISRLAQLLTFFGVANVGAYERVWGTPAAEFRQSRAYAIDPNAVSAWLRLGELAAQRQSTSRFDLAMLRASLPELRSLTVEPLRKGLSKMVAITAACGISVIFVPEIPGARAYGATRWIGGGRHPVVQLSRRGGTDDKLWATFYHELGHIIHHDRKVVFIDQIDDEIEGRSDDDVPNYEKEAQNFAWSLLIPAREEKQLSQLSKIEDVLDFAEQLGIAPGLVVSRLQALKFWTYQHGSALKRRVHDADLPGAEDSVTSPLSERDRRRMTRRLPGSES